jgi:glycosyltransferase involved in cell wall biosynthesis
MIMPILNERDRIEAALDAGLGQNLDEPFEVIVADGMSSDGTRQIVHARAKRDDRLRLLDNERRSTPCGLNVALAAARGRYVVRLDGHTIPPPDYARRLVAHLQRGECEAAGGIKRAVGESPFGEAVAAAFGSRFGIGNARHHYPSHPGPIDHIPQGAYVTALAQAIGGFAEDLVRNQDYDFDYRYSRAGGRILFDPTVVIDWYVRETPGALARQCAQYGYWKYIVLRRHSDSLNLRWLVPPVLVASLLAGALLANRPPGRMLLGLTATGYGLVIAAGTSVLSGRIGPRRAPLIALALTTIHLSWGTGFLAAAARDAGRLSYRVAQSAPRALRTAGIVRRRMRKSSASEPCLA